MLQLDEGVIPLIYHPKPNRHTKNFARQMRKSPTDAEHLLWRELRNRHLNGYKFVRQHRIGSYLADFCCRSEKLIIELDGFQHANSAADEKRSQWLCQNGYSVLRFWNDEVVFYRMQVLDTILAALEHRLIPPHPSSASVQLRFTVPSYPSPQTGEEQAGDITL